MTEKSWVLTDVDQDKYIDALLISHRDVGGAARGYSIRKRRLHGGLRDGVDVLEIDNGVLSVVVLPTRGMGIWRAAVGQLTIGWNSPNRGPVHPRWVPLHEPSGLGWLEGFDELLVRCGLENNGAPVFDDDGRLAYPLHGRIANRPAHHVSVSVDGDSGQIQVRGIVEETRFHFAKLRLTSTLRTWVGQPRLEIHDQVTNFSACPADMQLLYHINFGPPLLEAGARIVAPVQTVVPRDARAAEGISDWATYGPPQPGATEQCYFARLVAGNDGRSSVLLKNAMGDLGASLDFHTSQLPCFTLWKNGVGESDGYVTGLEPGTNFPNPRSFEQKHGRLVSLSPGGSASFELGMTVLTTRDELSQVEADIARLQGSTKPRVHTAPLSDWCAG